MAHLRCANRFLPGQLGATVGVERVGLIALDVGFALGAIKNVIGGIVHQQAAHPDRFLGHDTGSNGIDRQCKLRLALCLIYSGVGGGIDNDIRPGLANHVAHSVAISQFELPLPHRDDPPQRHQCPL